MDGNYFLKVLFVRIVFLFIIAICIVLYSHNLVDYVILISFLLLFSGIFSLSALYVTSRQVTIRKNYFWGLIGMRWNFTWDQITSIRIKDYSIDVHEEAGYFSESMFSILTIELFKPKVRWLTTVITYVDKGIEKDIELKVNKADYREIERKIKQNTYYGI